VALAATQGRVVTPDPYPERGTFYRADQFSFAKVGVPVAYFYSGNEVIGKPKTWGPQQIENYIKNNYHKPSDTYRESFDFSGAIEDMQLAFYLGVNIANADKMPTWNKGDEFEAARLRSLNRISN
jgi:Zn-dependent M28 family amino/carboxypeptidase